MTETEIMNILYGNAGTSRFGTSVIDQYRNAHDNQRALDAFHRNGQITDDQYKKYFYEMKSSKGAAIAGGAVAGMSGAAQILNGANELSRIEDTSDLDSQIDDIGNIGNRQYGSLNDITQGYLDLSQLSPDIDYMQIRGKSDGQRAAGIGSNMLSGASAGMTIGGPVGAAIGAGVGAVASGIGIMNANRDARDENRFLENKVRWSKDNSQMKLSKAHDTIQANEHRDNLNVRAFGGRVRVMHYKGNGGTVVKLRRK